MQRLLGLTVARLTPKQAALLAAGFAAVLIFPDHAVAAIQFSAWSLVLVTPAILLGVLLTAGVTATGSMAPVASAFQGRQGQMVVLASFLGAIAPVCGISVLPLVAGLLVARVPLAPIMAFWLSSPVTDPAMLTITAATLGIPFAIGKTTAAFLIGLFGGGVTYMATRAGYLLEPEKDSVHLRKVRDAACGCDDDAIVWRFWGDAGRRAVFRDVGTSTLKLILIWLSIAFVAEYFLKLYIPHDLIARLVGGDSPWAVPLAASVGAPIYLDGYAALPLLRGLMEAGMRPDAAMAFLVAGGIISAWAAIPVFALVRLPVFATYIGLAVFSSMLAGWGYGLYSS